MRQNGKGLSKTIRIGAGGGPLAVWRARYTQEQLRAAGQESEIILPAEEGGHSRPSGNESVEEALLRGDIDVAVHFLEMLPARQPEGLAITAVSRRENPAEWLLVRRESMDQGQLFQLKEEAVVAASTALRRAQLLGFRPGLSVRPAGADEAPLPELLRAGDFDALLSSAAMILRQEVDISPFHLVAFSPKELVPAPGQGALAWQANADDKATRRIFRLLHYPEVSALTNVERSVLKLLGESSAAAAGVYCERDAAGYYHIWAAMPEGPEGPVRHLRLSQSTSHLLAERVVEALLQ